MTVPTTLPFYIELYNTLHADYMLAIIGGTIVECSEHWSRNPAVLDLFPTMATVVVSGGDSRWKRGGGDARRKFPK